MDQPPSTKVYEIQRGCSQSASTTKECLPSPSYPWTQCNCHLRPTPTRAGCDVRFLVEERICGDYIKRRNFDYDLVAFFNIEGVKAFFSIFTDFKQGKTIIGAFGEATQKELEKRGYRVLVKAPYGEIKSMVMAIEQLFKDNPTLSR